MPPAFRLVPALALCLGALTCTSCGRLGRKPVYPVTGRVLYNGRPVPGAFVAFHPLVPDETAAPAPVAQTGADSTFRLSTYTAGDGVPAGDYRVTVEWRAQVRPNPDAVAGSTPNRLPERYARPETSPLSVRVAAAASNDLGDLKLTP